MKEKKTILGVIPDEKELKKSGKEEPEIYNTYEEAKQAVQKLGITSKPKYVKRYKEDSRLPRNPDDIYKNKGWINWYDFLGKEKILRVPVDKIFSKRKIG